MRGGRRARERIRVGIHETYDGTYLSGAPSNDLVQVVLLSKLSKLGTLGENILVLGREVAQSIQSSVGERHATKFVLLRLRRSARGRNRLRKGQRGLQLDNSLSQEGQAIVESSASLVEALMRHGQPLGLIREDLVAAIAEQANVESVQQCWVGVNVEGRALGVEVETEWCLCLCRSVGPSGLVLVVFLRRGCVGAGWEDCRNWASSKLGGSAGGSGRPGRKIQSHCVGGLQVHPEVIERESKEFGLGGVILPTSAQSTGVDCPSHPSYRYSTLHW